MPKGSRKRPKREDEVQAARRVLDAIIEKSEADAPPEDVPVEITPEMRAAAAAFGRIGGKIGGPARAAALTKAQKVEIAKKAAAARWAKAKR